MKERGISLIALIITIIVIIILAVVVVASAGDVIEDARFAKFEQEFGEYQQALQIAATQKKAELALQGITNVTDAQIYYMVAKGLDEVPETVTEAGKVASLTYDIQPASLGGTSYYEITPTYSQGNEELGGVYAAESNPALNRTTPFYSSTEKVYVTDSGEAFTLPGYPRTKNGVTQHYVNEKKYYTGEKEVEEETVTFTIEEGFGYEYFSNEQKELWNQCLGSYTVPKGTTWQDFIDSEYCPKVDGETKLFGKANYSEDHVGILMDKDDEVLDYNVSDFSLLGTEKTKTSVGLNHVIQNGEKYIIVNTPV